MSTAPPGTHEPVASEPCRPGDSPGVRDFTFSADLSPEGLREELHGWRENARLSRRELAKRLGVSEGLIRHWENGDRPIPRGRLSDLRDLRDEFVADAPAVAPDMRRGELRAARERAGLRQTELALMLGVKQQTVAEWEASTVPENRRDVLRKAAEADVPFAARLLRAERERVDLTQAELGERLYVTQKKVSQWECGELAIPSEEWVRVREVLTGIGPRRPQQPVTAQELKRGRERLRWTQARLASKLPVGTSQVGAWEAGLRPVPRKHCRRIREVLRLTEPTLPVERDRVAEALPLVLAVIDAEAGCGIGRQEVVRRVDAPEPHIRGAILRALEQHRIHEGPVKHKRADGVLRYLRGLFPGPAREELHVDRVGPLIVEAIAAVRNSPGRTRRAIAASLPHDRQRAEEAIDRAITEGALHSREVINRTRGGAPTVLGLYVDAAPLATPLAGEKLRKARELLVIGQAELADQLGVRPALLRRWERSEAPAAWRDAIETALGRPYADADARKADAQRRVRKARADLRPRILEAVRAQPGIPRWGGLPRYLRPIERPQLGPELDKLIAEGELHERPCDNGHGAGLFVGPAPEGWRGGPQFAEGELRAMRERAGLRQKDLAERIGAGVNSVNAWERGTALAPVYRRAQLRRTLAEPAPPAPALLPGSELLAERRRVGWSQLELAERIGVTQATVSAWEHGHPPAPACHRDRLRELFAAAPTAPRISRRELRRFRRDHGLTSGELGELLGVPQAVAVSWQRTGVPPPHAAAVRELLDRLVQTSTLSPAPAPGASEPPRRVPL